MKSILILIIAFISVSLNAQTTQDKKFLNEQFANAISNNTLSLDKVKLPSNKIENGFIMQSAMNYCKETGKCKYVLSQSDRGIYSDELATLVVPDGIVLSTRMLITSRNK